MRLPILKRRARLAALQLGHDLGNFRAVPSEAGVHAAYCRVCQLAVHVVFRPALEEPYFYGEALEANCRENPKAKLSVIVDRRRKTRWSTRYVDNLNTVEVS